MKSKKVLIVAGEASGDLHAGNLIRAVHAEVPTVEFYGLGGSEMRAAGARVTHDLRDVSVIGLVEVLGRLPTIWRTMRALAESIKIEQPDLAVLVDFPDFNLRLAARLKKAGIPVLWYISPQIWAWRSERINKIIELIDHMLVILPFEVDFYRKFNLNVHFVGHPLVETVKPTLTRAEAREQFGLRAADPVIALLPGSRNIELKLLLPHLLAAAQLLYQRDNQRQFIIPIANSLDPMRIEEAAKSYAVPIKFVQHATYDVVAAADCAVVAAGTATLETALLNTPEIIIGRVSRLTWLLWSRYTSLPYYGLPNWIIDEKIIKELIQDQASPAQICQEVELLLSSPAERTRLQQGYERIRARLGAGGASERAAQALLAILAGNRQPYALVATASSGR